jgi:trk system potassium uptake protein TrkH
MTTVEHDLFATVHPGAASPVRLGGRALDETAVRGILSFTIPSMAIYLVGVAMLAVDASRTAGMVPLLDIVSATAATPGNVAGFWRRGADEQLHLLHRPLEAGDGLSDVGRPEALPVSSC